MVRVRLHQRHRGAQFALALALALAGSLSPVAGLCALAPAGPGAEAGETATATATAKGKAINTICPVTGNAVDAKLVPVVVVIGKGEKAKRYVIGIAVASAIDTIKGDPQKYAEAARANKKAD